MIASAYEYHRRTSYDRRSMSGHYLDWANQPSVFKSYPGTPQVALKPDVSALQERQQIGPAHLSMDILGQILLLTHCVTATARHGAGEFYYRSVASAGALYPFELYVGLRNIDAAQPGLYHHNVKDQALSMLREGDIASELKKICGHAPQLSFLISAIFFRSSWKYRDRAYRYHLLDSGHLLENLTQALSFMGLPPKVLYDFDDAAATDFLGLDAAKEAPIVMCVVDAPETDHDSAEPAKLIGEKADLAAQSTVSQREVEYPLISTVSGLTRRGGQTQESFTVGRRLGLQAVAESIQLKPASANPPLPYPKALFRRRSLRNFTKKEMSFGQFSWIAHELAEDMPATSRVITIGALIERVEGVTPGFYVLTDDGAAITPCAHGEFLTRSAHICLDQGWLVNCAIHFVFLTNIGAIEDQFGPRAYRYAMLWAGALGQRIYVGATRLELGCCGIGAFYDREMAQLLGVNEDSQALYVLGVGPVTKVLY